MPSRPTPCAPGAGGTPRRRKERRLRRAAPALLACALVAMIAPITRAEDDDALMARFERMVRYNLDNPQVVQSAELDSVMRALADRPLGERIAAWADWFHRRGGIEYRYGRSPGGYVSEGRLCQDAATDCVLFVYRVTELARSSSAVEAVQFAFGTRFYGATVQTAILDDGRVDYDDPAHLDFAEEMVRSGIWGEDVTAECGAALLDAVGSAHAAPDTLRYLPVDGIDQARLRSGDLVWMVGDENRPEVAEQRRVGTLIHHLGILVRDEAEGGEVWFLHAAARPLPPAYDEPGVRRVRLSEYLRRVERFKGIVVTRLKEF